MIYPVSFSPGEYTTSPLTAPQDFVEGKSSSATSKLPLHGDGSLPSYALRGSMHIMSWTAAKFL